jgi:hypothetical protein
VSGSAAHTTHTDPRLPPAFRPGGLTRVSGDGWEKFNNKYPRAHKAELLQENDGLMP